ncbi:hypothetical protein TNCT_174671 [Trichonephila clavata]|uniref:Uncharacterized protein n=1 Tax=Trichonephila clavata TaxID=2740835 RepID=A0A8X6EZS9_TRICU|nr:hypothetical protein TNCT_174671 [Trichonephila clavata]
MTPPSTEACDKQLRFFFSKDSDLSSWLSSASLQLVSLQPTSSLKTKCFQICSFPEEQNELFSFILIYLTAEPLPLIQVSGNRIRMLS